jgi:hypothetical protein
MKWFNSSIPTTMIPRLKAMPYQSELWRQRYPKLVNILEDDPAVPKGNVVARNISFGGRWDEIEKEARTHVTMTDNLIDQDPLFEETPPKSFRLRESSPAYDLGFKPIPFEQIGLVADPYRPLVPPAMGE